MIRKIKDEWKLKFSKPERNPKEKCSEVFFKAIRVISSCRLPCQFLTVSEFFLLAKKYIEESDINERMKKFSILKLVHHYELKYLEIKKIERELNGEDQIINKK